MDTVGKMNHETLPINALVIVNSASPAYPEGRTRVLMFLDHFDVPYTLVDLLYQPLPPNFSEFPLWVLAHPQLDPAYKRLGRAGWSQVRQAVQTGSGVVSFDPQLSAYLADAHETTLVIPGREVSSLTIASTGHYITANHSAGQVYQLDQPVPAPQLPGQPLVRAEGRPFLSFSVDGGRLVHWASTAWMDTHVLGPLAGLDDLFWRSLVWAARKPFCLRGLPPIVTMRVDDVAGTGGRWKRSPLYWAEDAIRSGFRPWLGLFIYNLDGRTVSQLRSLLQAGKATAFPHAFGRPPRPTAPPAGQPPIWGITPELWGHYYQDALPLRADSYDEFIYFDHHHRLPWSNAEAQRGLQAVDGWYAAHAPLSISKAALPHWYEMGSNTCAYIRQEWRCEFLGTVVEIDRPLTEGDPWLRLGPFRRYEEPGECFPHSEGGRGRRPVYYADFLQVAGQLFFNTLTEIRDDYGYEWAPDGEIEASVARGVRQLRRAFDSMALGSLFTHETDYIYKISPESWAQIMMGVAQGIASYHPIQMTLDDGARYLRARHTSRLSSCSYDPASRQVSAMLEGFADLPTHFYLFTGEDQTIESRLVEVPGFEGRTSAQVKV